MFILITLKLVEILAEFHYFQQILAGNV